MVLSGGYYGGYEFLGDRIELDGISELITMTITPNEFYVTDDNSVKHFYRIETDSVIFIGF